MLSAENLASIESEGWRLARAVRRAPDLEVPQYPGWSLTDLAQHTASIHARTVLIYRTEAEERVSSPKLPPGSDPIEWYEETLDEMLAVLTEADPRLATWALGSPQNFGFWERRMVIETGVHRWDAYRAHGEADRLTDVVAVAGMDEFPSMWLRHLGAVSPLRCVAADVGRSWDLGDGEPEAQVEGAVSDIYLRLMSRPSSCSLPEDWSAAVDGLTPTPKPKALGTVYGP